MSLYLGTNCISAGGSSTFRNTNVGEIIQSTIPLTDAGLHLLDGSVISGSGAYSAFVTHIAGLVSGHSELFTTEANWQTSNDNYGACDKFVYDSVNNTVRLPKRVTDHGVLIKSYSSGTDWYRIYSDGFCEQGGYVNAHNVQTVTLPTAFRDTNYNVYLGSARTSASQAGEANDQVYRSTFTTDSFNMYINNTSGNTIFWHACGYTDISDLQQTPVYEYIVIANTVKTPVEVDIDEVMTDLNGKVDIADLAECSVVVETWHSGTDWYRIWSDGWCEQGGQAVPDGTNHDVTITFLKPFIDTNYFFTKTNNNNYTSSYAAKYLNNVITYSTSQVVIGVANSEIGNTHWQASGYIS